MVIKTKQELKSVLREDANANRRRSITPKLFGDEIWKYIYRLRLTEYYSSFSHIKKILNTPRIIWNRILFHKLTLKCGYSFPIGKIGKGLSIAHLGTIVINGNCIIGDYFRVQEGVTLGTTNGSNNAPKIGDRVFIGSGAKIIGGISIADDVAVGANAVVVKDILEPGTTWGGIPAKKISEHSSRSNLSDWIFHEGGKQQ